MNLNRWINVECDRYVYNYLEFITDSLCTFSFGVIPDSYNLFINSIRNGNTCVCDFEFSYYKYFGRRIRYNKNILTFEVYDSDEIILISFEVVCTPEIIDLLENYDENNIQTEPDYQLLTILSKNSENPPKHILPKQVLPRKKVYSKLVLKKDNKLNFLFQSNNKEYSFIFSSYTFKKSQMTKFLILIGEGEPCELFSEDSCYKSPYIFFNGDSFTFGFHFNGCGTIISSFTIEFSNSIVEILKQSLNFILEDDDDDLNIESELEVLLMEAKGDEFNTYTGIYPLDDLDGV